MHLSSDFCAHHQQALESSHRHKLSSPQALIQPGAWSLSGEETSARLMNICSIGYKYARLSHIAPEAFFIGLCKHKEQNQKPNQPKP